MIHYLALPKSLKYADRESVVLSLFQRDPYSILIVPTKVEKDLILQKVGDRKRDIYTEFKSIQGRSYDSLIIDQVDCFNFFDVVHMIEKAQIYKKTLNSESNIYLIFSSSTGTFR